LPGRKSATACNSVLRFAGILRSSWSCINWQIAASCAGVNSRFCPPYGLRVVDVGFDMCRRRVSYLMSNFVATQEIVWACGGFKKNCTASAMRDLYSESRVGGILVVLFMNW
jgi:hypothetical protein